MKERTASCDVSSASFPSPSATSGWLYVAFLTASFRFSSFGFDLMGDSFPPYKKNISKTSRRQNRRPTDTDCWQQLTNEWQNKTIESKQKQRFEYLLINVRKFFVCKKRNRAHSTFVLFPFKLIFHYDYQPQPVWLGTVSPLSHRKRLNISCAARSFALASCAAR